MTKEVEATGVTESSTSDMAEGISRPQRRQQASCSRGRMRTLRPSMAKTCGSLLEADAKVRFLPSILQGDKIIKGE